MINIMNNRVWVIMAFQLFFTLSLSAQTDETADKLTSARGTLTTATLGELSDNQKILYKHWEETLQFGIESEVLAVIEQMIDENIDYLANTIQELFFSKRLSIRLKTLDYFEAFERSDLIQPILSELNFYQDIGFSNLTERMIQHLTQQKYPVDDDLWLLLEEMLQEEGRNVQLSLIMYLGTMQYQPAALALRELYQDADVSLQESILKVLGQIGDQESQELIFNLATDENGEKMLRLAAIQAAGAYRNSQALEIISQAFSSSDPLIRAAAVSVFPDFSESDVQELYLEALRDSFWRIRLSALRGIATSPFANALAPLKYMAHEDPETNIKQQAFTSIAALDVLEGWAFLRENLVETKLPEIYRQNVAVSLIKNNFGASYEIIEEVMLLEWAKKDSRLLDTICKELSIHTLPAAESLYEKMLEHENFIIRIYGVRGVGRNKILRLRPRLIAIAENKKSPTALKTTAQAMLEQF